jgi:peptide-methionine (S)-S-oxide reductase
MENKKDASRPSAAYYHSMMRPFQTILLGALLMALINPFTSKRASAAGLPDPIVDLAADKNAKPGDLHTAVVAGGCFWCIDGVFRQMNGVTEVVSGYAGGSKETADYETVSTGVTGHAEAVKVTYDPAKITYGQLLRVLFTVIDPTTKNRQGPDSGTQYRSAIFYENPDQKNVAEAYIKQLDETKTFPAPIVTTLEPLKTDAFYPAEAYHQNYVACHLNNPYVQYESLPKIAKAREAFPDKLQSTTEPVK